MRSLDSLLPADDPARVVWEFVRKLDLSEYYLYCDGSVTELSAK